MFDYTVSRYTFNRWAGGAAGFSLLGSREACRAIWNDARRHRRATAFGPARSSEDLGGLLYSDEFGLSKEHLMARGHKFSDPLDQQIYDAHRRYIEVMEDIRMGAISNETKEKYLQIITALTEKLALPSKPLSEIIGEMMSEAAPFLFQSMQNR
jgi:hypothetical protein